MKSVLSIAAAGLLISSAAFAQTAPTAPAHNAPPPANSSLTTPTKPSMSGSSSSMATTPSSTTASSGQFTTVSQDAQLSSEIVGLSVYNSNNKSIGTIKDIAYSDSGVKAYILGVGGVMGVGDHYVAVNPSDVNVTYDANAKKWHATMNATEAQLKAAPQFNYPSKS